MSKLTEIIEVVNNKIDRLADVVIGIDNKIDLVDTKVTKLDHRFTGLKIQLDTLEQRFTGLEGRFDGLETRFDVLECRFDEMEIKFTNLDLKVTDIAETQKRHLIAFVESQETQKELVSRVGNLEKQHTTTFNKLDGFLKKYLHQQTEISGLGSHCARIDGRLEALETR